MKQYIYFVISMLLVGCLDGGAATGSGSFAAGGAHHNDSSATNNNEGGETNETTTNNEGGYQNDSSTTEGYDSVGGASEYSTTSKVSSGGASNSSTSNKATGGNSSTSSNKAVGGSKASSNTATGGSRTSSTVSNTSTGGSVQSSSSRIATTSDGGAGTTGPNQSTFDLSFKCRNILPTVTYDHRIIKSNAQFNCENIDIKYYSNHELYITIGKGKDLSLNNFYLIIGLPKYTLIPSSTPPSLMDGRFVFTEDLNPYYLYPDSTPLSAPEYSTAGYEKYSAIGQMIGVTEGGTYDSYNEGYTLQITNDNKGFLSGNFSFTLYQSRSQKGDGPYCEVTGTFILYSYEFVSSNPNNLCGVWTWVDNR